MKRRFNTWAKGAATEHSVALPVIICALMVCGGTLIAQNPPDLRSWQSSASRLVDQGNRQQASGELAKAISSYNPAISLESKNAEAYAGRALAEETQGKLDDAEADYTLALRLRPGSAEIHCDYATLLFRKGDTNGATAEFIKATRLNKHIAEPHAALGMIYYDEGKTMDALAQLDHAIRLFPEYLGDPVKLAAKNPHLAAAYDMRGLARQTLGDLKGALDDFDKAIGIDSNANYYNNRAQARSQNGDPEGAIVDYSAALNINPNLVAVYFNRGNNRLRRGDFDGAVSDFTETLSRDIDLVKEVDSFPSHLSIQSVRYYTYINRGLAWEGKGNVSRAMQDYGQAIHLDPQPAIAHACVGRIYLTSGRLEDAMSELDLAIAKDPAAPMPYMDRGLVHLMKGNQSAADDDFKKCLAINPGLKSLLDRRAQLVRSSSKKMPASF